MPFSLSLPKSRFVTLSLLVALLISGLGLAWGVIPVFSFANNEFTSYELDVAPGETKTFNFGGRHYAFGFRWKEGEFKFRDESTSILKIVEESHDLEGDDEFKYSEMHQGLQGALTIKNTNASEITLFLMNPQASSPAAAVGEIGINAGGGLSQINLASGANISNFDIVNRSEWGANESASFWDPKYKDVSGFIIHHTVWINNDDYRQTMRAMFDYHTNARGWGDIGYNYVIDPQGNIYEGRRGGAGVIGAHAYDWNAGNIGIAMMGDFTNQLPTRAARRALRSLLAERANFHQIELEWGDTVIGHKDTGSLKACPGDTLYPQLNTLVGLAEEDRVSMLGNNIHTASLDAAEAMNGYKDVRLKITYTEDALLTRTPEELTPVHSGIVRRQFDDNSVTIVVESIPGSNGDWSDDTRNRLEDLYTIFSLDSNVESVEKVTDEIHSYANIPRDNQQIELEYIYNPYTKYTGNLDIGTGTIEIYEDTEGVLMESFDVTDNTKARLSYRRFFNVYPDFQYLEGKTYRIVICDGCLVGEVSGQPLPGREWSFSIKESTFTPIHRFWSGQLAAHFYTANGSESNRIQSHEVLSNIWDYERVDYYALSNANCHKGQRVHRFWSNRFKNHFYTINHTEYEKIVTDDWLSSIWDYEGTAFCAYNYERYGSMPVYRFWSDKFKGHFYTMSLTEKRRVERNYPDNVWKYEKIAFYAMPSADPTTQ